MIDPLLILMSWLSPGYPVGGYAYSHGLETAISDGDVTGGAELKDWVTTVLLYGSGRVDGVLFREAHRSVRSGDRQRLAEIAEFSVAFQATAELALESRSQGEAFLRETRAAWPADRLSWIEEPAPAYPVAVAVACAAHDIDMRPGLVAWYHAVASNLISAAVRLVPLGQTEGQKALAALATTMADAVRQAECLDFDGIGTAAPRLELLSIRHETQYTRLFRS